MCIAMNNFVTRSRWSLSALCLFASSAFSSDVEPLFGQWGNEAQCSRALITLKGTKHFAPFDIRPDWLGHGDVWCRLTWSASGSSPAGVYARAFALCGEDSIRDYQINFELSEGELTLRWNQDFKNGPLRRCAE